MGVIFSIGPLGKEVFLKSKGYFSVETLEPRGHSWLPRGSVDVTHEFNAKLKAGYLFLKSE